jgi:hypothetical protein
MKTHLECAKEYAKKLRQMADEIEWNSKDYVTANKLRKLAKEIEESGEKYWPLF